MVEWSDAKTMNATLGRMSTLLEHPTLCGQLVDPSVQRRLPSNAYLGHNLYAHTLLEFERLALAGGATHASGATEAIHEAIGSDAGRGSVASQT